MEFCKCGGLLVPKTGSTMIECRMCGKKKNAKSTKGLKLKTENVVKKNHIFVVEKKKNFEVLPTTDADCPECNHGRAHWWMLQTRAGDEPPTRFFKCEKCKHVWREYE
jgi:transcription factor S